MYVNIVPEEKLEIPALPYPPPYMYIRMHVHRALVAQIFSVACRNAFLCAILKDVLSHFLLRGLGTRLYTCILGIQT